jgi:hypothetical protein
MAFQMPAWKAPGVSLSYRPLQTPAAPSMNPQMLAAMAKMPQMGALAMPTAAPANSAQSDRMKAWLALPHQYQTNDAWERMFGGGGGGFNGSSQSGSYAGFSGTPGARGFSGRYGGGPGNRG